MNQRDLYRLLNAAMPGLVFEGLAPEGTPEPYVVYALIIDNPTNTLNGSSDLEQASWRVDSYAKSRQAARTVMDTVTAIINACNGDPIVSNRQDFYEQDTRIHRVSLVVSTWYEPDEVQS